MSEFSTASSSPPILIWQPEGGVPGGPVSNPPIYSQSDVTQLVEGQAYIDVVFGSVQTDDDWVLVACEVENTTDFEPLNIWPGIVTDRTAAGFRLQLNGMPDSGNYYLHWAVSGINITPSVASTYYLTGPTSGPISAPTTFTVALPPSTTLAAPVVVTPNDGVLGTPGTFSPTFVTLTTGTPSATFTYTPASYGVKTISTTNSGPLSDPAAIVLTVYAATYTLTGPSSGSISVPSTNFTVALPAGGVVSGTITVTLSDGGGGGSFTPTTVNLTTAAPSATFTYTPASTGTKTISVTNNGGLTDPGSVSYVVSAPFSPTDIAGLKLWLKADSLAPLTDGTAVGTWSDSSGSGNTVTGGATFYNSIVNGKPIVRFNGTADNFRSTIGTVIPSNTTHYTLLAVIKAASTAAGDHHILEFGNPGIGTAVILRKSGADWLHYINVPGFVSAGDTGGVTSGVWTMLTADWDGTNIHLWRNQTLKATTAAATMSNAGGAVSAGCSAALSQFWDGDIAELLVYNSALSSTDRGNAENFLKTKYGL